MKKPKVFKTKKDVERLAEKYGLDFNHIENEPGCFGSSKVTIHGNNQPSYSDNPENRTGNDFFKDIRIFSDDEAGRNAKEWEKLNIKKLPGVKCPYCNSQGYATDFKQVAVCGACPGWYFFYESNEDVEEADYTIKIVNGQLLKVPRKKKEEHKNL